MSRRRGGPRKGSGRPKVKGKEVRTRKLTVSVTESEYTQLKARAGLEDKPPGTTAHRLLVDALAHPFGGSADPGSAGPSTIGPAFAIDLKQHQRVLRDALARQDERLADMYHGAVRVLGDHGNPDHLQLAAHGLREMMRELPRVLDVPMQAHGGSMKSKVFEAKVRWENARTRSGCHKDGKWDGPIDLHLERGIRGVDALFGWVEAHHSQRRKEALEAIRRMDSSSLALPEVLEELNAEEWHRVLDYFTGVSHHRKTTPEDFDRWLSALERFLLDRLRPLVFADQDEIDALLEAGE